MTEEKILKILKETDYVRTGGSPEELKCAEYLVAGYLKADSEESVDGAGSVCLPRQRDGSLSLRILFPDSGDIRSFPLGEYILQSGYDWNAADLEDIDVEVDFSLTGVSFTIDAWKKTLYFEIRF